MNYKENTSYFLQAPNDLRLHLQPPPQSAKVELSNATKNGYFTENKFLSQLHFNGTLSKFYTKNGKFFVGTVEGRLYYKEGGQVQSIELSSPKLNQGLLSNFFDKLNPTNILFKSTIVQPNKKSFLSNLVDVSYKNQPNYVQKYNMEVTAIELSNDEEILFVAVKCGEVHIFLYPSFQRLEVLDLWSSQTYLYAYNEQSHKGVINILESQLHQYYELLCADDYGTMHKFYLDYYKVLNKKSLSYKHFLLLQKGQQEYSMKWWEQAQLEFDVRSREEKQLLDLIKFESRNDQTIFYLLWTQKIQKVAVLHGKKEKVQQLVLLGQHQPFENLHLFYERFNQICPDEKINANESSSRISRGVGTYRDYYQNSSLGVLKKSKLILINYGPSVYIFTTELQLLKFGILSCELSALEDDQVPEVKSVNFVDENVFIVFYQNSDSLLHHIDEFGVDPEYAKPMLNRQSRLRSAPASDLLALTFTGRLIPDFKVSPVKFVWDQDYQLVYVDQSLRVMNCNLKYWKSYIAQFVEKGLFIDGIKQCYKIINQKIRTLNSLPELKLLNLEIKPLILQLALGFTQATHEVNQQQLEQILYVIQFLLVTRNEDILFQEIREYLKKKGKQEILYSIVNTFHVHSIPPSSLIEMAKELPRPQLYRMLQNLDIDQINLAVLAHICLEYKFIDVMIYFCNKSGDYVSPVEKLMDDPDVIRYIIMVLKGRDILGNEMSTFDHWLAVKQIISYIFIPGHFAQLLRFDKDLQVALHIFQTSTLKIIQQQQTYIQIVSDQIDQSIRTQLFEQPALTIVEQLLVIVYQSYVQQSDQQSSITPNQQISSQLQALVSTAILSRQVSVRIEEHFKLIKYYLSVFNDLEIGDKNEFIINHLCVYFQRRKDLFEIQQIQSLLTQHIKANSLIYCYLLYVQGKFLECFKTWMSLSKISLKNAIFCWLKKLFNKRLEIIISDSELLTGVKSLLQINPKETFILINSYFKYKQAFIINQIEAEDSFTVGFTDYMLELLKQQIVLSDKVMVKYIEYLCKNSPKQVKAVLQQFRFPIKESLEFCVKYKVDGACRYLYELVGDLKNVIEILSNKLVKNVRICTKTIVRTKKLNLNERLKVLKTLKKIKLICDREGLEYELRDNLWLLCLDRFFREFPLKNLILPNLPEILKDQLLIVVTFLLSNMLDQMNFYDFVQVLMINYGSMPVKIFSKIFRSINDNRYQQEQFYHIGQILLDDTKTTIITAIYEHMKKGFAVRGLSCQCTISDQFAVLYRCNHTFHLSCLISNKAICPICCNQLENTINKIKIGKISLQMIQHLEQKTKKRQERIDQMRKYEHHYLAKSSDYLQNIGLL